MNDVSSSVFAPLTAPGRGGIAVVRCVGPSVAGALEACFHPTACGSRLPAVGRLAYGHLLGADEEVLDEVILYRAGAEAFEVNCHGGPAAVEAVCERLAGLGLVQVEPDALLSAAGAGPIERDARWLLRSARTPLVARVLLGQLAGALEGAIADIQDALAAGRADEATAALDGLLDAWRTCGRRLADPPRVVIAGRPNVGKSTLLNRLVGGERVITSATPGTTRDYVETVASFGGLPVVLVDTAGERATAERIEREGVARARQQAEGAALVVYLLDATQEATEVDMAPLAALGDRGLAVWNKSDLANGSPGPPLAMAISARAGDGLDGLRREVLDRLDYRAPGPGTPVPIAHHQARAVDEARRRLAKGHPNEAAAVLRAIRSR